VINSKKKTAKIHKTLELTLPHKHRISVTIIIITVNVITTMIVITAFVLGNCYRGSKNYYFKLLLLFYHKQ